MIGYQQLLATREWQEKRKLILRRDNNTCQRCGISHKQYQNTYNGRLPNILKSNLSRIEIINTPNFKSVNLAKVEVLDKKYIICKTSLKQEEISNTDELVLSINFGLRNKIKYPFDGSTIANLNDNYFLSNEFSNSGLALLNSSSKIEAKVNLDEYEIDKEGIWLINAKVAHEVNKSGRLHVHHKCYRKGMEIWDQEDDEYISLCNICHRIVHENQLIPYFNEYGKIYQMLVPCWKCSGQRYLEAYRHRDNGVCYGCRGKGFNENKTEEYSNSALDKSSGWKLIKSVSESITVIEFMKRLGYNSYAHVVIGADNGPLFLRFNPDDYKYRDVYFSDQSSLVLEEEIVAGEALTPELVDHFRVAWCVCENGGYEWRIISELEEDKVKQLANLSI